MSKGKPKHIIYSGISSDGAVGSILFKEKYENVRLMIIVTPHFVPVRFLEKFEPAPKSKSFS